MLTDVYRRKYRGARSEELYQKRRGRSAKRSVDFFEEFALAESAMRAPGAVDFHEQAAVLSPGPGFAGVRPQGSVPGVKNREIPLRGNQFGEHRGDQVFRGGQFLGATLAFFTDGRRSPRPGGSRK